MGVVYEAEQQHPKRAVALKVIRGGRYVDEHQIKMFQREAQTLARLKHPAIAAIYESGRTEDGQHFFAMELVRGESLTDYLARRAGVHPGQRVADRALEEPARRGAGEAPTHASGLTAAGVRERLALFRQICEAVSYAHQRGVIHRDLKPSNVLVVRDSGGAGAGFGSGHGPGSEGAAAASPAAPHIKILDFGLARITDTDVAVTTIQTEVGKVQGTVPYMSPEQVRGNPDEIDLRTDVYSLGVVLYEMLTGRLPYEVARVGLASAVRVICEEPPKPLSKTWRGAHRLDGDVATIVLKALEKAPSRRYQSASALTEDVDRYLANQPILARPPSAAYQIRKLITRHKAAFTSAAALFVLLAGFAVTMAVQAARIARERDRANQEAETARQVSEFLTGLFEVSDPNEARGNSITAREILDRGAERIERELKEQPLVRARLMDTIGNVYRGLGLGDKGGPLMETALAIREKVLGEENLETTESMIHVGGRARLQRALEIREKLLGPDHVDVAWALYSLGLDHIWGGDYDGGRNLLQRARSIFEQRLGFDDRAVAWCVQDIGFSYELQSDYAAAKPFYVRGLRIKEKCLPPDHPDVARGLNNLGWALTNLGEYQQARPLLDRAYRILERALGPEHPELGNILHSLGELARRMGKNSEARAHFERALAIQEKAFSENRNTALTLNSLALVLAELGESGRAEAVFKRALAIREKVLPSDDPSFADTLEGYAALLRKLGRPAEASPLEVRARGIRAKAPTGTPAPGGSK